MTEFWDALRRTTQARIGLGRAGNALPTSAVLELAAAHSTARDAVHEPLDVDALATQLTDAGFEAPLCITSRAADRAEYLRRPDLGREPAGLLDCSRIWEQADCSRTGEQPTHQAQPAGPLDYSRHWEQYTDQAELASPLDCSRKGEQSRRQPNQPGLVVVLADGLSARAVQAHAVPLLAELQPLLTLSLATPVVATQARVALGDHVGAAAGAQAVLVLIGERPGLSVNDGLGLYLTWAPRPGRTDAERNCVSNVHPPDGLGYVQAARAVAGLLAAAAELGESGVRVKDRSRAALPPADGATAIG